MRSIRSDRVSKAIRRPATSPERWAMSPRTEAMPISTCERRPFDLLQLALDPVLAALESFQVLQDQVLRLVGHAMLALGQRAVGEGPRSGARGVSRTRNLFSGGNSRGTHHLATSHSENIRFDPTPESTKIFRATTSYLDNTPRCFFPEGLSTASRTISNTAGRRQGCEVMLFDRNVSSNIVPRPILREAKSCKRPRF